MDNVYERNTDSQSTFCFIGNGELGGKAQGLVDIQKTLEGRFDESEISVSIPRMTVIRTDIFDQFMQRNDLWEVALELDDDDQIAHMFQKAALPATIVGDLRHIIQANQLPLAVRSSSLLEDSCKEPFAGVYATKMIPNNQFNMELRFQKLVEAIKYVWSSMFFQESRGYFDATGKDIRDEKMAVIIQEVIGNRYEERYYPVLSGVARSFNFYPTGNANPEDGVVNLALGLGKTIVDGGVSWYYSPRYPAAPPPFNGLKDLLNLTQTQFYAINMGNIPEFNPIHEAEFLMKGTLKESEEDGTLRHLCSSWDYENDRIVTGLYGKGARVLNFSPILQARMIPLNDTLLKLLKLCEERYETHVEIEFAMMFDREKKRNPHLGFLQVRPMNVSGEFVELDDTVPKDELLLDLCDSMGNGVRDDIRDIVYLKPDAFDPSKTRRMAEEIEQINRKMVEKKKPYLLIGFGRWGSSDSWLGIPVSWRQISGARVVVESTLPNMRPELSQGSHFFHNMIAFDVMYFTVRDSERKRIDWQWIEAQKSIEETTYCKHVELGEPLRVFTDGRMKKGMIAK